MEVLLLRPDKAGDALKTLPVLRSMELRKPIHLLVSPHNESLFRFEPHTRIYVLPKDWEKLADEMLLSTLQTQGLPTHFDKIVNLLCDPTKQSNRLLKLLSANNKYSVASPKEQSTNHSLSFTEGFPVGREETINIADLVGQALGRSVPTALQEKSLKAPREPKFCDADYAEALELMGMKSSPWLGFCPFAGTSQRTHPIKRWKKFFPFATRSARYSKFFLFGAETDRALLEELKALSPSRERVEIILPSSFRSLGTCLERCEGVIAVDSGPLHLSLALGIPSLGFLSGGDALRWFSRYSPQDKILKRGLVHRYPSVLEMDWSFKSWEKKLKIG